MQFELIIRVSHILVWIFNQWATFCTMLFKYDLYTHVMCLNVVVGIKWCCVQLLTLYPSAVGLTGGVVCLQSSSSTQITTQHISINAYLYFWFLMILSPPLINLHFRTCVDNIDYSYKHSKSCILQEYTHQWSKFRRLEMIFLQ